MDLSRITKAELSSALEKLTGHERETTLKILYHLIELERRRLFEDEGYSSLFDYCVRKLRYSEAGACRRIAAARALQEHPEIAQLLLEGKVNLCTVATASRGLKTSVKVEEIAGKSLREVQRVTALSDPRGARPRERIRPVAVKAEELPLFKAERAREVEERYEIRFSVSKDEYERFQAVRRKLSNTLGRELTVERVSTMLRRIGWTPLPERRSLLPRRGRCPEPVEGRRVSVITPSTFLPAALRSSKRSSYFPAP